MQTKINVVGTFADVGFNVHKPILEDNQGCIKVVQKNKINPCSKHTNIKCEVKDFQKKVMVDIQYCSMKEMVTEILIWPLSNDHH